MLLAKLTKKINLQKLEHHHLKYRVLQKHIGPSSYEFYGEKSLTVLTTYGI